MTYHERQRLVIPAAILLNLCFSCLGLAHSQELRPHSTTPDFWSLRTPDSPAFVLLGVSPSAVQRPTSTRDLAVALANDFVGDTQIIIPNSFALEVSPFWIGDGAFNLTLAEFSQESWRSFYQNATLSVATTTEEAEDVASGTVTHRSLVAIGVRTTLYEERPATCSPEVEAAFKRVGGQIGRQVSERTAALAARATGEQLTRAIANMRDEVKAEHASELEALAKTCQKYLSSRPGLAIDVAGAATGAFPEDGAGQFARASTWSTLGYTGGNFAGVMMVRYTTKDHEVDDPVGNLDFGGRLIFAVERYAFSGEVTYRRAFGVADGEEEDFVRLAGLVDVNVGESTWLNFALGHDFDDDPEAGNLLAIAGLKVEFGDRQIELPDDGSDP